jgi:hypothetical protein
MRSEIEKLIDDLWGRALDVTSSTDFSEEAVYQTAQTNYRNYSLKQAVALFEKMCNEVIGEDEDAAPGYCMDCGQTDESYSRNELRTTQRTALKTKLGENRE